MEWGIFNDEGCIENGFGDEDEAKIAVLDRYCADDGVHIAEICHDHPDQEHATCEHCNREDA